MDDTTEGADDNETYDEVYFRRNAERRANSRELENERRQKLPDTRRVEAAVAERRRDERENAAAAAARAAPGFTPYSRVQGTKYSRREVFLDTPSV